MIDLHKYYHDSRTPPVLTITCTSNYSNT